VTGTKPKKADQGAQASAAKEIRQFAVFSLGEEKYAVDIGVIKEIIRPVKITHIPRAPLFIEGVVDIRGDVIPVIEMRKRFEVEGKRELSPRMIIVRIEDQWVGILVDTVTEVIRVPASEIKPPPRVMGGDAARYFGGVCSHNNDLVVLLNLNEILTGEEKISLRTIQEVT
jgi:purine-binding chemotaxis protein CheW